MSHKNNDRESKDNALMDKLIGPEGGVTVERAMQKTMGRSAADEAIKQTEQAKGQNRGPAGSR